MKYFFTAALIICSSGCQNDRALPVPAFDFAVLRDLAVVPEPDMAVPQDMAVTTPDMTKVVCKILNVDEAIKSTCCQHVTCSPGCFCTEFKDNMGFDAGVIYGCIPIPAPDVNCNKLGAACRGPNPAGGCCQRQNLVNFPAGAYCNNGICAGDVGDKLIDPTTWKSSCRYYMGP